MTEDEDSNLESERCSCGFPENMHCMYCGECPTDEQGTLGDFCTALGLWTDEGEEVEAPCVSEKMASCRWCGVNVMEDWCEHQVRVPYDDVDEYKAMIDCDYDRVLYAPASAPGNASVLYLYVVEDVAVAERINDS